MYAIFAWVAAYKTTFPRAISLAKKQKNDTQNLYLNLYVIFSNVRGFYM